MNFKLTIFAIFVSITLIGGAFHELVRTKTANAMGYTSYRFKMGELWFENEVLRKQIKPIRDTNWDAIHTHKPFPDKEKWDNYINESDRGYAMIELAAKIFTFGVSFLGIIILFFRRKKTAQSIEIIDWVGLTLSLFIMKQVLISTIFISFRFEFCDYAAFVNYFKLPFWGTEYFFVILGLQISTYVIFKVVPSDRRIVFFFNGLMGGTTGIALWYFVVGKFLFGYFLS